MKRKLLLLMLLPFFLTGCHQEPWKKFSSSEGAFSVLMPGTPTEQIRTASTASGSVDAHMFLLEQTDVAYMVAYSDYPNTVVQDRTPDMILDGARDGAVANAQGRLLGELIISLDGHQGRELHIETAGGNATIKARIFIVGRRLYQVMVLAPKEETFSPNVNKFLDSFTFQHPKAKTQPAEPEK